MNADSSSPTAVTKLTANRANGFAPVIWSANSTQIVFDSSRALDGTDGANSNGTVNILDHQRGRHWRYAADKPYRGRSRQLLASNGLMAEPAMDGRSLNSNVTTAV